MNLPAARRWISVSVLVAASLLFHRSFRIDCVSGNSMWPTFHDGDWLLVAKRHADSPEPRRGELVIARAPTGYLVKRIVGLPGEAVEVIHGAVHIDDRPLPTGAPREQGCLQLSRGRLLPGRYALLGDHRNVTPDLAEHAVVGRDDLVGRVVARLFPRPSRMPPPPELAEVRPKRQTISVDRTIATRVWTTATGIRGAPEAGIPAGTGGIASGSPSTPPS